MNPVTDQLIALTAALQPVAGTEPADLAELRRFLAAVLIQQNPGIPVPVDSSMDPAIAAALTAGAALAAQFVADGVRARFLQNNELTPSSDAMRPSRVFGPFADRAGHLSRFLIFQSAAFQAVHVRQPNGNPTPEVLLLLPSATAPQPGGEAFAIPAGTVWIRARFLVAGAAGMAGLRIAGGTFTTTAAAASIAGRILVNPNAQWVLSVEPEPPPAGEAGGSDVSGASITLPQTLEVRSDGRPTASGAIGVEGFGSALVFNEGGGAPTSDGVSVRFPFGPASLPWTIEGNLSTAVQLAGSCDATLAVWSLPLDAGAPANLGEAADGGAVQIVLAGRLAFHPAGLTGGSLRSQDAVMTACADCILMEGRRAEGTGRMELELWNPALSRVVFGPEPITRVLYQSERERGDMVVVHEGGTITNRWDLPLRATGSPFSLESRLENFAILARANGLFLAAVANRDPGTTAEGLALENLYLTVRQPSRLVLLGAYDGAAKVPDGTAIYSFDVVLAQPSLPDPYATNWNPPDAGQAQQAALSTTLTWQAAATPSIESRLERRVLFPEPGVVPADEDATLRELFDGHLGTHRESLSLLDLSSNEDHLGVAMESLGRLEPTIRGNQLNLQLSGMRLLMQPQVLWEPVQAGPVELASKTNGARTLAGSKSVKLVPVLPGVVAREWVQSARDRERCGVMFSLPFGLRAFARFDSLEVLQFLSTATEASLHAVEFGPEMASARQLRLKSSRLRPADPPVPPDPARTMAGSLRQMQNLRPNAAGLASVVDDPGINLQMDELHDFLPLHQADLSGYGLSTFSDWRRDAPVGITQARFDVMIGRTSLEVIQARTILAPCEAHLVRSIVMERRNSGRVLRFDSGWVAVDDGLFESPAKFEKGVVIAYRKIRRIRLPGTPLLTLPDGSVWQEVLYDCDAELENVTAGGQAGRVPVYNQAGYIQVLPTGPLAAPTANRMALLFAAVKGVLGGPADIGIRVGGTLDMQVSGLFAGVAPKDNGAAPGFVVAAYGSPKLPRAGQWSAVGVSSAGEASAVDPRRGIPVIRLTGQPYTFRDPADANRSRPATEYGLLMTTPTSRVLFPVPSVNPLEPGVLRTAAPAVADPMSLAQATGVFPRSVYSLRAAQAAAFDISGVNDWRMSNAGFDLTAPLPDLAKGGEWAIQRLFPDAPKLSGIIDSALEGKPWEIGVTPNDINIEIDPFGKIFVIKTNYSAISGELGKLQKPSLDFGPALDALREIVNALKQFVNLGLDFDVDVTAGSGPSPSFIVVLSLKFRLGEGPNERIDIGVGKFYGEFHVTGQLEAALSGSTRGRLLAEFQGDIQQGVIPPLVYAGGMFRFALEIKEDGSPTIELGLGMTTSLGGDLIKNLLEVEVTIVYGYTLIPETLQPGVLLGLEARAKLLGGLIGFSFAVQAMARILRADFENVTIFADIRVVATVQVAWLIEEDVDIRTQFEQNIPLRLAALPLGGGALALTAAI
ncbi:hypothetical protein [Paludibaculum fermentans]|uniref:Uncharacterized protein n=1 Tax=Paludibaculum fermentans TaxID=1473598 RepID=A0A7S7NUQ0_PALFE|nr:hypothetical protein [Paludibaculum fermentans]QOY90167.1 hypothetical protein IRI77_09500 [Paludibaculum fermentans]